MAGDLHGYLVKRAVRWLLNTRHMGVALAEAWQCTGEQPDAIGWRFDGYSILVECKASRADFVADRRKSHRRNPNKRLGHERWYMTPPGLVCPIDVPEGWGLLEAGKRVRTVVKPPPAGVEIGLRVNPTLVQREFVLLYNGIRNGRCFVLNPDREPVSADRRTSAVS